MYSDSANYAVLRKSSITIPTCQVLFAFFRRRQLNVFNPNQALSRVLVQRMS